MQNSPIITKMQVIPVAGYDGMLMTLSGAHAPCFTRNLVVLTDNAGHTGVGEIHGGDYTCDCLNAVRPLVEGQPVARYREVLQKIHRIAKHADGDDGDGVTGFVEADLVQEGHVEEDDLGTLARRKEIGPILGDKRVDGRVDPIKRGGVGLDDLAQAGATDGAVFNGVRE